MVISGDHGDDKRVYFRLGGLTSQILNPLTAMYVPDNIFSSPEAKAVFKSNQEKVVSILDVYPTLQHIMYGRGANQTDTLRKYKGAADISQSHS